MSYLNLSSINFNFPINHQQQWILIINVVCGLNWFQKVILENISRYVCVVLFIIVTYNHLCGKQPCFSL